ncbi:DUF106 domain-containing protein [Halopiger aswanensis]|uniref:Uncharacterized membrane protein (DUF106 family) n=1 Tax=Halopiger aswanensis TaxID=148449 RepID=A0A3R7GV55_9EURY|nr:DUF106 domain-containing protein [Halopiger aswanensis]RKD94671.1 uncharacterized membrane protein (DUF106 family) [Halopiger aswanensis]
MPVEQLELLLTDPAMQEALAVVVERSEDGDGTEELEWRDVKDTLSSEQWGRLLEHEVLVSTSAGTGFALAEPDRVRERLAAETDEGLEIEGEDAAATGGETESDPESDAGGEDDPLSPAALEQLANDGIEPQRWSTMDKAAGAFALALFAGYWSTSLRNVIASVESVVLGPITGVVPFHELILLLAVATGLYSTVLQSRLSDRDVIEHHRERMTELQERKQIAEERGDEDALERVREAQTAAAADQLKLFKVQFRPTVWIMLLTIPVFLWLRWKVRGGHLGAAETGLVVPIAGAVSWQDPLLGPMSTWIVWYFLGSMASRQLIRKLYDFWAAEGGPV